MVNAFAIIEVLKILMKMESVLAFFAEIITSPMSTKPIVVNV